MFNCFMRGRGSVEDDLEICYREFLKILSELEESFRVWFSYIIENPVIKSTATFLDIRSYSSVNIQELLQAASVLVKAFRLLLEANGFNLAAMPTKIGLLHTHVVWFLSNCFPNKCWQRFFEMKETLGIKNVLHLAEISIVILLSNAKAEHAYSFLWRVYSREQPKLKNSTLEDILQAEVIAIFQTRNMKKLSSYLWQRNKMVLSKNVWSSQQHMSIH